MQGQSQDLLKSPTADLETELRVRMDRLVVMRSI